VSLEDIADCLGLEYAAVQRLAVTFLTATGRDLVELEAALAAGDAEAVARLAHHIKGAAGALEVEPVRFEAEALERQARAGSLERADAHLGRLRAQLSTFGAGLNTP